MIHNMVNSIAVVTCFALVTIYAVVLGAICEHWDPRTWFRGPMSDKEFNALLDIIFHEDGELVLEKHTVCSNNYVVRFAMYSLFQINSFAAFSLYQKYTFFRRLKKEVIPKFTKKEENAQLAMLNKILSDKRVVDKMFHNEVDSKLNKESISRET